MMSDVKTIEARFLMPKGAEGTHDNRELWQRSWRQKAPFYENGRLVIFRSWVTFHPLEHLRAHAEDLAHAEGWELLDVYEK